MNYASLITDSIVDGTGVRVALFVSGCRRHCNGCFNKVTWDFNYGTEFTSETMQTIRKLLADSLISGISILGGEPFEPENRETVREICVATHKIRSKNVWIYTGFTLEELQALNDPIVDDILALTDVLVDGPFIEEKRDLALKFRGSSNQRIIDMYRTNLSGKLMLWEDEGVLF